MALDSRNKRASAIGFKNITTSVYPDPDGDLANQPDRQQIANEYSGIASAAGGGGDGDYWRWMNRKRRR